MQKCLNTITLGSGVGLIEALTSTSKAGFEAVEIFSLEPAREFAKAESIEELMSIFDSLSIKPVGFVLGGFVYASDAEFAEKVPGIRETMEFAGQIGAANALLFIPSKGDRTEQEAREVAVRRIGDACDLASEYGLRIGLEPIGKADYLNAPSSVYPLIQEIGATNLFLTIDIFHFYTAGCATDDLRDIPGRAISLVHVDDAPDLPLSDLDDSKRLLPGDGSMEVAGFLGVLGKIGFDGALSVELFNRDLWTRDSLEVATWCKAALDRVMDRAGVE